MLGRNRQATKKALPATITAIATALHDFTLDTDSSLSAACAQSLLIDSLAVPRLSSICVDTDMQTDATLDRGFQNGRPACKHSACTFILEAKCLTLLPRRLVGQRKEAQADFQPKSSRLTPRVLEPH